MKKGIKILSFVLALAVVISTMSVVAFAEGETENLTVTLSAKKQALIVMSTSKAGSYAAPSSFILYVDYSDGTSGTMRARYTNRIASFNLPEFNELVESVSYVDGNVAECKQFTNKYGNSNGDMNIYSSFDAFPYDIPTGNYTKEADDVASITTDAGKYYKLMYDFTSKFRTSTDDTVSIDYPDINDNQITKSLLKSGIISGTVNADGTKDQVTKKNSIPLDKNDFITALRGQTSGDFTIYTGWTTSKSIGWGTKMNAIPSVTVTYSKELIADFLRSATSASDLKAKIAELEAAEIVVDTAYAALDDVTKTTVCEKLYTDDWSDWASFKASLESIMTSKPVVTLDSYVADTNYSITVDGTTYASDNTIIMYGTVKGNPATFGYMLQQLNEGASVGTAQLKFEGSVTKDGKFAIRVIGAGITSGSYNAWPFYTTSESDTAVESETKTSITVS